MSNETTYKLLSLVLTCGLLAGLSAGCNSATYYRQEADRVSYKLIEAKQREALGQAQPFTIERPADTLRRRLLLDQGLQHVGSVSLGSKDLEPIEQWPDDDYLDSTTTQPWSDLPLRTDRALQLIMMDALQVAARNSRRYQSRKEQVYQTALDLDLERDSFRYTWAGGLDSLFSADLEEAVTIDDDGETDQQTVAGKEHTGSIELSRRFKNGMSFTGLLGLDLVKLLTQDRTSSRGLFADASISIPLLRGSGKFVVTEPLTQAERDMVYAIYGFERFKRVFAVTIASDYLSVLQQLDQLHNAEENYRRLVSSTRRVRRLADAGRLPEIQVDQARQDELRSRNRWVSTGEAYKQQLDVFKILLGLPTDAAIELDPKELTRLAESTGIVLEPTTTPEPDQQAPSADAPIELIPPSREGAGPLELDEDLAIVLALEKRLDLRTAVGRVYDLQRKVAVAADALRADLTLLGSGSIGERRTLGSSASADANLRLNEGRYSALIGLDLPLERTAERNLYRNTLIGFEQSVRDVQELEDEVKLEVRNNLRDLLESRESLRIQAESVKVAKRRVASTGLFLRAGRAKVRDVLEAQEALISAQNALTSAVVRYRVAELSLQRDLGVLEVDENGLWREFVPEGIGNDLQ